MERDASRRIIGEARKCADIVQSNAHFIEEALPNVPLDKTTKEEIKDLYSHMSTVYLDILEVAGELEEKLRSENFHFKSFKTHSRLVVCWMREIIDHLNLIVTRVQENAQTNPELQTTFMLLAESAVNLMNAFEAMDDTIEQD